MISFVRNGFGPNHSGRANAPAFGCRFLVNMSSQRDAVPQDVFIRQALVAGQDSLHALSVPKLDPDYSLPFYKLEDSLPQRDGWGIASYHVSNDCFDVQKSEGSAYEDPAFQDAAQVAQRHPQSVLAHIREGEDASFENAHPFQDEDGKFVFMHNGTIPWNIKGKLEARVVENHRKFGTPLPKGTRDTEVIFLAMLGEFRKNYGTTDTRQLSTRQLETVFTDVIRELQSMAVDGYFNVRDKINGEERESATPLGITEFQHGLKILESRMVSSGISPEMTA